MQQLLKVLIVTGAAGLTFGALPLAAADRIALVGCDLNASGGPLATFLQIAGESDDRPGIPIQSQAVAANVAGRSCADVLADLADDGFAFQSADVSGRLADQWVSIWQANH